MADPKPKKPPTYEELAAETAALKKYALALEVEVRRWRAAARARDAEFAALKASRKPRAMDKSSPNPFQRPWDGR